MPAKRYLVTAIVMLALLSQATPISSPTTSQVEAASYCDWAQFVMDVTVPDGTILAPNTPFTKTWRLKNIGTCTWTTAYAVVYSHGDMMSAPPVVNLPYDVPPGATVDVSVQMTSPPVSGHFRGNWFLRNAAGAIFGIGSAASSPFWVDVVVSSPTITAYDFSAEICAATWHYDGGPIPCPYREAKKQYGYAIRIENPILENGTPAGQAGILTVPHQKYNGIIMGVYPEMDIMRGDHFQAIIGCQYGATDCYVTFELDYMTPDRKLVTIWKFKERYDGMFYRADVDLSKYADKKGIKLVLIVRASGPAGGDQPVWVAPSLVREVASLPGTPTPLPATATPMVPTPTPTATLPPASACDKAEFVQDVSTPDGTDIPAGQAFTKTWRLKNVGSCTWTPSYSLTFVSGDQMGGAAASALPATVLPGQTIDLTAYLTAPTVPGTYKGYWMLRNPAGGFFGIGPNGDQPFWVSIDVPGVTSGGYDFAAEACNAVWVSGAGVLPCPGTDGSSSGFVLKLANPVLENGVTDTRPGLLTAPQMVNYGWIQGVYPALVVQAGDHFQSTINCEYGASGCDVYFRLDYQIASGPINTLWAFHERYEGLYYNIDLDLSSLSGQNAKFILTVLSNGAANGDRAVWVAPRLVRTGVVNATPTPAETSTAVLTTTPTPTATPTPTGMPVPTFTPTPVPTTTSWLTFTNTPYGFRFNYPPQGQIVSQADQNVRIQLPFVPGTNLVEKYLDASVLVSPAVCKSPLGTGYPADAIQTSQVIINGINFLKESGADGAAGSLYQWTAYSTQRDNVCVSLGFVLHSHNPGVYSTPPPLFDEAAESAVFVEIVSTYAWLPATPTPVPTASSLIGPYSVYRVADGDVLNIRSAAGVTNPIVSTFPRDAVNVMRTGPITTVNGSEWVEVMRPDGGGTGWVNFYYLTEYVAPATFCGDARIAPLIEQFKQAVNQSSGQLFAALVSPRHGVNVNYWLHGTTVNYTTSTAQTAFTSTESINWGGGASGIPDVGTFAQIVQPKLADVLNSSYQLNCNNPSYASMFVDPWSYLNVNYYAVIKPPTPGIELDWRLWLMGFEYVNGQPYLMGMTHFVWEP